jgi:hypothetical protein
MSGMESCRCSQYRGNILSWGLTLLSVSALQRRLPLNVSEVRDKKCRSDSTALRLMLQITLSVDVNLHPFVILHLSLMTNFDGGVSGFKGASTSTSGG